MESPQNPERRGFLKQLGSLTGGTVIAAHLPAFLATMDLACTAEAENAPFSSLRPADAVFVEAVAARIIPTDHRPGAREAGVVRFIDMCLHTMPPFTGANELIRELAVRLGAEGSFHTLDADRQDALLREVENEPAFGVLQFLTVAGFLSHPSRGGNQGKVGWQLIGFDDAHAFQPPFGHYDAEVAG